MTYTQTPEHKAKAAASREKTWAQQRFVDRVLIEDRTQFIDSEEFKSKVNNSNTAVRLAQSRRDEERANRRVNPDGSRMSDQQLLNFLLDCNERGTYKSTELRIKNLRAKINGENQVVETDAAKLFDDDDATTE